jgi:hypothetical protein
MGTIIGNYQQKAMALKIITVNEFKAIKDEFKALLKAHPVQEKMRNTEDIASAKNKTLRDVFRDKTLEKGLDLCQNQFDLFEAFELNGYPLRINREKGDQSSNNLEIKFIDCRQNISAGIVLNSKGAYLLKQENGKEEAVNAVLPLLYEDDFDLLPLLDSRLFKLIISYNCSLDADRIDNNAYLRMLSASILPTLRNERNRTFHKSFLQRIHQTSTVLYNSLPKTHYLTAEAPVTWKNILFDSSISSVSPSLVDADRMILKLVNLFEDEKIDIGKFKHFVKNLLAVQIFDCCKNNRNKIVYTFDLVQSEAMGTHSAIDIFVQKIKPKFKNYFTKGDLSRDLISEIKAHLISESVSVAFNSSKLAMITQSKVSFSDLQLLVEVFGGVPFSEQELEDIVITGYTATSSMNIESVDKAQLASSKEKIRQLIVPKNSAQPHTKGGKKSNLKESIKWQKVYNLVHKHVLAEFTAYFQNIHREVYPLPESEVKSMAWKNKVPFKDVKISDKSLLVTNLCSAPMCSFYFKNPIGQRLRHHLDTWGDLMPVGFHDTVRQNRKLPAEFIYKKCIYSNESEEGLHDLGRKMFGRTKDDILAYIQKLQIAYEKILD